MTSSQTHLWRVIQAWLDKLDFPPSQSKLALRLGVTRSAVSEWKIGRSRPTPQNLRALADLMEPQLGPAAYETLLQALNTDQGYLDQVAARDIGQRSRGQRLRDQLDGVGEESQDPNDGTGA